MTRIELWTGAFSWWKCHRPDLKSLASTDWISSWTPLKPQHSNPNHNANPLAYQFWCSDFITPPTPLIMPHRLPAFLESLMPLKNWCLTHARCSKSSVNHSIHFCRIFSKFKTELYWHIVLLKCQIAFLEFTSCDNQAVAVHFNVKS